MSESPRQNYVALSESEYAKLSREIKYLDIVRTGKYERALRDADIAHVEKLGWYLTRLKMIIPVFLKWIFVHYDPKMDYYDLK